MEKIKKSAILNDRSQIPQEAGIFTFSQQNEVRFIGYCSNLQESILSYFTQNFEDKNILQMISLTDSVEYQITSDLFSAFLEAKLYLNHKSPEFNRIIKPYNNYIYLGIDFYNPPFLKIMENTQDDLFYLGAFENRFLLFDFIDVMNRLEMLPNCPPDSFPCDLLKNDNCSGLCLKDNPEKAKKLIENYIIPNENIVEKLKSKQDLLMDELDFIPAEKLRKQIKIIEKYYDRVKFLLVTKDLESNLKHEDCTLHISQGMIKSIIKEDREFKFFISKLEFRDNERLALEKDKLAEAYFVYQKIDTVNPELINEIFINNSKNLIEKLQRG